MKKEHPPSLSDPVDDPLLPFVLAARAGDSGAERELLTRLGPVALEVARRATGDEQKASEIALQTLIATLRALPTFRGEESVVGVVARMAHERAGGAPTSNDDLFALAEERARRGRRSGDAAKVASLVERALKDDAAVLVSHFVRRTPVKARRGRHIAALLALSLAALVGFLLTRAHTEAQGSAETPNK